MLILRGRIYLQFTAVIQAGPLPVWLALLKSPVLARAQNGRLTSLDFSPYHLIPEHPDSAIKPDPVMHMDQCCSSWFPVPLLCLGKKKKKMEAVLFLSLKMTIRLADYSPFLMTIRKLAAHSLPVHVPHDEMCKFVLQPTPLPPHLEGIYAGCGQARMHSAFLATHNTLNNSSIPLWIQRESAESIKFNLAAASACIQLCSLYSSGDI